LLIAFLRQMFWSTLGSLDRNTHSGTFAGPVLLSNLHGLLPPDHVEQNK
jgi:hypothetical protein